MSLASPGAGNLLVNGAFLSGLWTRLSGADAQEVPCPVGNQTFAADRWRIRYAAPAGGEVNQARSEIVPPDPVAETSLEIRGGAAVTESVYVGQAIDAQEASSYRRELRFTAWCRVEHPSLPECPVRLVVKHAANPDGFDASVETLVLTGAQSIPANEWKRVQFAFDASAARGHGLSVELELPAAFLSDPQARVRVAAAALWSTAWPEPAPRPHAVETLLARRFFQRHTARSLNAIGRALVCNVHELHFQLTFPEMRAAPAITLPQDNADLTVFSFDGVPQAGFVYDVTYASCGSAIIRATKWDHGLADGYLAFRGYGGAILLEAEL